MLGGDAEAIAAAGSVDRAAGHPDLAAALRLAVAALAGPDRTLDAGDLEVALLDRSSTGRCFRRLERRRGRGPLPIAAPAAEGAASRGHGHGSAVP